MYNMCLLTDLQLYYFLYLFLVFCYQERELLLILDDDEQFPHILYIAIFFFSDIVSKSKVTALPKE